MDRAKKAKRNADKRPRIPKHSFTFRPNLQETRAQKYKNFVTKTKNCQNDQKKQKLNFAERGQKFNGE